jgi:hypothetical protein
MQAQSKSLNGIRGSCFDIRLEYNKEYVIVHLPVVEKMTKETFIEMSYLLEDWTGFFKTAGYKGLYAVVSPESKAKKLASMLKFVYLGEYEKNHIMVYKD